LRDSFINSLLEQAKKDPNIYLITGDLGFGVLEKFQEALPNQFINSGVNEQSMMGLAAGLASTGKKVFVYSIGNFPTLRCLEQIRNDICYMNNPVTIVSVGGGYSYGNQGYTHHAIEDVAVMRALPNMEVIIPSDEAETRAITKLIVDLNRPSYLRLSKKVGDDLSEIEMGIEFGKVREIRHGLDGTILFTGSLAELCMETAVALEEDGFKVSVASMPFISSIDLQYLKNASNKGPLIHVEEHSFRGGSGSALLEKIIENDLNIRVNLVAAKQDNLANIGAQAYLREINGINKSEIISKFKALLKF